MRRRIVFILMLLVAGAIVNVAVAWGCVAWAPRELSPSPNMTAVGGANFGWSGYQPDWAKQIHLKDWGQMTASGIGHDRYHRSSCLDVVSSLIAAGYSQDSTYDATSATRPLSIEFQDLDDEGIHRTFRMTGKAIDYYKTLPQYVDVIELQSGWPLRAARGAVVTAGNRPRQRLREDIFSLLGFERDVPWQRHRGEGLPFIPIWPGFAINTIFYAAILWVVFFAPGKLRRTIRRRRGLCPACAYPVGASPVCTECGAALQKRPT